MKCLDTSITANIWVECESDSTDRVSEAVVRTIISQFMPDGVPERAKWLNPTEEIFSHQDNLEMLKFAILQDEQQLTETTGIFEQSTARQHRGPSLMEKIASAITNPAVIHSVVQQVQSPLR